MGGVVGVWRLAHVDSKGSVALSGWRLHLSECSSSLWASSEVQTHSNLPVRSDAAHTLLARQRPRGRSPVQCKEGRAAQARAAHMREKASAERPRGRKRQNESAVDTSPQDRTPI
eukprot:2812866-Rhodomonas_salina.1